MLAGQRVVQTLCERAEEHFSDPWAALGAALLIGSPLCWALLRRRRRSAKAAKRAFQVKPIKCDDSDPTQGASTDDDSSTEGIDEDTDAAHAAFAADGRLHDLHAELQPRAIFHALHQTFDAVRAMLPDLAASGFDAVQVAPAQQSPAGDLGSQWYLRYQPVRYGVIDPHLGGEEALERLCAEAACLGIMVIADCVFNHAAVVASRSEWQAAQSDHRLLEELKCRLDRTFGPELTRHDFQWPWVCLEGSKWDDPKYTYEGWGCGEWSELRVCERVLNVHFDHLSRLLACGVRGFRLDAAKHMRPDHVRQYVGFLHERGACVYVEVLSMDRAVHAHYESLGASVFGPGAGPFEVRSTDYLLAKQLRDAFKSGSAARVAAAEGLGHSSVRFVRSHDSALNDGPAICGLDWASPNDARAAWAYVLARPEGGVLVYEADANVGTVQRAVAFRRAVAEHCSVGIPGVSTCAASTNSDPSRLQVDVVAWPPPGYSSLLLLLKAPDGTPVGLAAINLSSAPLAPEPPWDLSAFDLLEVQAGAQREQAVWRPLLGAPFRPSPSVALPAVSARDARFFLVRCATVDCIHSARVPREATHAMRGLSRVRSPSFGLFYYTPWAAPHVHFGLRGRWTESPGWPLSRARHVPKRGKKLVSGRSSGSWWTVRIPLTHASAAIEFVLTDGHGQWEHAKDGGNFHAAAAATYILQGGFLKKVDA